MTKKELAELQKAFANYMWSEGCGCCEGHMHDENKRAMAILLKMPIEEDGSVDYEEHLNK